MIEQTTWSCDNDINASAQLFELRVDTDATKDDGMPQSRKSAISRETLTDLSR